MLFSNHASGLRLSACIGATLALVGLTAPAISAPVETAWICEQTNKPGEQYVNVTFNPTRFGIESAEDDDAKPGWSGPEICSFFKVSERDLPIMSIRYELMNMPCRSGSKLITCRAIPWSTFCFLRHNRIISLMISPISPSFQMVAAESKSHFSNAWKAQSMTGKRQNAFDIAIGQAKRLVGDGNITRFHRYEPSAHFSISRLMPILPSAR